MSARHSAVSALMVAFFAAAPALAQAPMELVVNIPAGRLEVFQGGEKVRSYPVSVGQARYATPTGEASIRRMVWNPTWTPPPDAAWARDEKPAGPGWSNPMGRVKMHLFGDYYVHGTPARNERHLGSPASHGCIRMRNQDVMELAQLVLRADGAPVSEATVQGLVNNPRATRELALAGRVRVRIEYQLTSVETDSLAVHPDVYRRAAGAYTARVANELSTKGQDPAAVLAKLAVTGSPGATVRVPRTDTPLPVREPVIATDQATPAAGAVTAVTAMQR
jgi:murein L,D-transpeptidase YcbB/YkuD